MTIFFSTKPSVNGALQKGVGILAGDRNWCNGKAGS
jgi:hypothetical protein